MSSPTIKAQARSEFGRRAAAKYRAAGSVPTTVLRSGDDSVHLLVDEHQAEATIASGALTVVVEVEGSEPATALVRDVSRNCINDRLEHIDLLQVDPDSVVKVDVPVSPITLNCPGIKAGGLLEQMVRSLRVRCAVKDIPKAIEVDLSGVGIAQTVYVENLTPPAGVTLLSPGRTALMTVLKTRAMKKAEAQAGDPGKK